MMITNQHNSLIFSMAKQVTAVKSSICLFTRLGCMEATNHGFHDYLKHKENNLSSYCYFLTGSDLLLVPLNRKLNSEAHSIYFHTHILKI